LLRIHVNDPGHVGELRAALAEGDCSTVPVSEDTLLVTFPLGIDEDDARTELLFFLRAWQARRPEVEVELLR